MFSEALYRPCHLHSWTREHRYEDSLYWNLIVFRQEWDGNVSTLISHPFCPSTIGDSRKALIRNTIVRWWLLHPDGATPTCMPHCRHPVLDRLLKLQCNTRASMGVAEPPRWPLQKRRRYKDVVSDETQLVMQDTPCTCANRAWSAVTLCVLT